MEQDKKYCKFLEVSTSDPIESASKSLSATIWEKSENIVFSIRYDNSIQFI